MSRRRGRDAFNVRFLHRNHQPSFRWNSGEVTELAVLAKAIAQVFSCIHGIPWKTCTMCSKPRTPQ